MSAADSASTKTPPTVYLFYGDDLLAMHEQVETMCKRVGSDPTIAELNITRLDGKQSSMDEVTNAAYSMPFLAERRLVVLDRPVLLMNGKAAQERFTKFLETLPATTAMILVQEDSFNAGGERKGWDVLDNKKTGTHALLKWAQKASDLVFIQVFQQPTLQSMPDWIMKQAKKQGGQFNPDAALALASQVGSDTQVAVQEIVKLLTFVNYKRPVEAEDVQELTAPGGQANVFDMIDAMTVGNARLSLRHLALLLEKQDFFNLFGLIVRQFRLMIQVKEVYLGGARHKDAVAAALHLHPFVAEKCLSQVQRYSIDELEAIYHRLLEIDRQVKTSQIEPEIALQTFVASLAV